MREETAVPGDQGRMLKRILALSLVSLSLLAPAGATPIQEAAQGTNQFATDLYGQVKKTPGNLFYSPYSITSALGMTAAGARGETLRQMESVLHFPKQDGHAALGALLDDLSKPNKGYAFRIANRIWPKTGYTLQPAFEKTVRTVYHSSLAGLDFGNSPVATKTINDWVAGATDNKIKNLIPEGALSSLTRMVLTNAIYFKGNWARRFDEKATRQEPFTSADGKTSPCQLMHQNGSFLYGEADGAKFLQMPYEGDRLAMFVALPKSARDLPALERQLDDAHWRRWTSALGSRPVQVSFPRYKVEASLRLTPTLAAMGMNLAFDQARADFSGMLTVKQSLFISDVFHKAFIEVNEKGTEAAAATAVVMQTRSMPREAPPAEFRADHSFVYAIRDMSTGTVLFMGRLDRPGT